VTRENYIAFGSQAGRYQLCVCIALYMHMCCINAIG